MADSLPFLPRKVTVRLVALALLSGLGCDSKPITRQIDPANALTKDSEKETSSRVPQAQSTDLQRQPRISRELIGLANLTPRNVTGDVWDSEQFSRQVEVQLKKIASALVSTDHVDRITLDGVADRSNAAWPLWPSPLQVVFQDDSLIVRRVDITGDSKRDPSAPQVSGFSAALKAWRKPLGDAAQLRCKFKVFKVDLTGRTPTTDVNLHLSGQTDEGMLQISADLQCGWTSFAEHNPPKLVSMEIIDFEESLGRNTAGPLFSDCTAAVLGGNPSFSEQLSYGLDHWLERLELSYGISAASYQGLSVADVNGDGLDDLYVCQPGGLLAGLPNRLFLQMPDGTATDASTSSRLDWLTDMHSALFVDLDNDGDQDMVAATVMGLVLAANDGHSNFDPISAHLTPDAAPISLAAADYDSDGDLDIYAGCYSHRSSSQVLGRPVPYHDANNGGRNVLLRNDGQWRFSNVTKQVGLDQNGRRFTLACAWEDYDNDGDQDLYVANDYGRNNLYENKNGVFRDVAAELGVEDISAGMSAEWGDYNQDGWMDIYVSNMWSSAGNRIAYQRRFRAGQEDHASRAYYQRHARGNSLFENLGPDSGNMFEDISVDARVTRGRWAWSSTFLDINNDSLRDLYVANGFITQENPDDL